MKERSMVVVAAGSSTRFGSEKLLTEVGGIPLIGRTLAAVRPAVDHCVLVVKDDQIGRLTALELSVDIVAGGTTRTESETAGLAAVPPSRLIGIHDGARPAISPALIEQLFETASRHGGAVPGLAPRGPLVERESLKPVEGAIAVQTPQIFWGSELKSAYEAANRSGFTGYDTADVVHNFSNLEVVVIPGDPDNIKVTYPEDLRRVRQLLE
jgi:2-C-methyl-D-erythritol 4-phosphate cytidylyltransferase